MKDLCFLLSVNTQGHLYFFIFLLFKSVVALNPKLALYSTFLQE